MKLPLENYDLVSVDVIERLLKFMEEAWLHGFPTVRKEDGRSQSQLRLHAALLLLTTTHCIDRGQAKNPDVIDTIREQIEAGGRLADDVTFFLEKVRPAKRYTKEAVLERKSQ